MLQLLRDATKHNVYAQSKSILLNGLDSSSHVEHITPWWETALLTVKIVTGILTILFAGLYCLEVFVWSKARKEGKGE